MFLALLPRFVARRAFTCFAALLSATTALLAQSPSAADGFDPNVDGNVYVLAMQPDGKLLVGGQFGHFRSREGFAIGRNNLARLNPDGSLDGTFNPNVNGAVRAILIQADGSIIIGGEFTEIQPAGAAVSARSRLARLTSSGAVDPSFVLNVRGQALPGGVTLASEVYTLALQADGALVVGGSFASVQPGNLTVTFARRNIFRLTPAGAVDAAFDPNPNGIVLAVAPHVDGKLVVAGGFTTFQEAGRTSATTRNRIARLNANGTLDTEFDPNANNSVNALAVQRDGKIVIGGSFTNIQPFGTDSAIRNRVARLNVDGSLDSEFFPNANGTVSELAIQPDGALLIGGSFTTAWGRGSSTVLRGNVARFLADGSLDGDFNPNFNAQVDAFAFQNDGKLIIGGYFTRSQPPGSVTAIVRNRLARLNADGSLDADFELRAGGRILATAVQADGKVVVGGTFTSLGGETHNYLARLNTDGTVDAAYKPDFNASVFTLAAQPDGKVIVGGAFTTIGGETRNRLARLNANGTIDSEFHPNLDGNVAVVVLQPDGKILVGGGFTTVFPIGATESATRTYLLRLNADGKLDTAFNPGANSNVSGIVLQPDGKILATGLFSAFTPNAGTVSTTRNFMARLNVDGTVDTAFDPNPTGRITALALAPDNKIVVGGGFNGFFPNGSFTGVEKPRFARLNADGTVDTTFSTNIDANILAMAVQSDGRILVGGDFQSLQPSGDASPTYRRYLARLASDGKVDASFNLDINEQPGNRVDSLRLLSDGRLLVGGVFSSLQPIGTATRVARANFVRINANGTLDEVFNPAPGGAPGGQVLALAIQADNKVVAVGAFSELGGTKTTNIARFNPEGTADTSFGTTVTVSGPINSVVVRPNSVTTASQLGGFAWLNRDGTPRAGFVASANARLSGEVYATLVLPDGSIILAGAFTNLTNATGGNMARFSAAGVLDTNFNPNPNGAVTGLVQDNEGRLVIVGSFTTVKGITRNRIARIGSGDGSVDIGFDPNASGRINAVALVGDSKLVVGGAFNSFLPNGTTTTISANYIARVNFDGTIDTAFNPNLNGPVNALAVQPDAKVIAGGVFNLAQPSASAAAITRNFVGRFNIDGTVDEGFNPNPNGTVGALAIQPNNQVVIGGAFSTLQPSATGTVYTRNNIARVHADGALDTDFDPNANGAVSTLALQPDSSIVLGGSFTTLQPRGLGTPVTRNHLARVGPSGALDLEFNPDVDGSVLNVFARLDGSLLVGGGFLGLQTNGLLVVGGDFASIGGVPARNLAALSDNGSISSSFQPRPDGAVNALLVQLDGKVIAGGAFTNIAGTARGRIARFNTDGTLDTAFAPALPGPVSALALEPDGGILVGGVFAFGSSPNQLTTATLVRLTPLGVIDRTLIGSNGAGGTAVRRIAVQADRRIVIVDGSGVLRRIETDGTPDGTFTPVQATSGTFSSLSLQADGRILAGGDFALANGASRLARFNRDGSLDTSFNPGVNGAVTAIALQSDGRPVIGGTFTRIGALTRVSIARLSSTGAATQVVGIQADRSTLLWARGGTTGEIAAAVFERSSDFVNWTSLGAATRVAGTSNWQLSGATLPASGVFYLRARGIAPGHGTSSGIYQSAREFNFTSPLSFPASIIAGAGANDGSGSGSGSGGGVSTYVFDYYSGLFTAGGGGSPGGSIGGTSRLADIATQARVSSSTPLLAGFTVGGTGTRNVLVRAIGPGLASFGVNGVLAAPQLRLYSGAGQLLATNDGWAGSSVLTAAFAQAGAFPLPAGSADAAALVSLPPGSYTIQVLDGTGAGGIALAEVYDVGPATQSTTGSARLINLSTRATINVGGNVVIGGFVVTGTESKRLLIRGVGPSLAQFGVSGVSTDPSVVVYNSAGQALASNDDWSAVSVGLSSEAPPQGTAALVAAAASSAGAFALDPGSKDAALVINLGPGAYTIHISDKNGASGAALIELYELP